MRTKFTLSLILALLATFSVKAQSPGSLDMTFNTADVFVNEGQAPFGVTNIMETTGGKLILTGTFQDYAGFQALGVARILANGHVDETFTGLYQISGPTLQDRAEIKCSALQSDGKIIIAGKFNFVNETARNYIARLNTDGTLDATFDASVGANDEVRSLAIQPDGKIIISGMFTTYNGTTVGNIARLNTDGTLDTGFNSGGAGFVYTLNSTPQKGWANKIIVLSSGKILVGGSIHQYNGVACTPVIRLNSNGSIDNTFTYPVLGTLYDGINTMAVLPSGKILVGGGLMADNSPLSMGLIQLNADGTLDTGFNVGAGVGGGSFTQQAAVLSIMPLASGQILVGGQYTTFDGHQKGALVRLNANGSVDTTFAPGINFREFSSVIVTDLVPNVYSIYILPGGTYYGANPTILCGGSFHMNNDHFAVPLARLTMSGNYMTDYPFQTAADDKIYKMVKQPDGKVLAGGRFTRYNNAYANCITRINADGTQDNTFNNGEGIYLTTAYTTSPPKATIYEMALQSDGKILIGGDFETFNNVDRPSIARLNSDGTLDNTFALPAPLALTNINSPSTQGIVKAIAVQADGKILVGGNFKYIYYNPSQVNAYSIIRLNADGSRDNTFNVGTGMASNTTVNDIYIQPDGKILVTSGSTYNGVATKGVIRLYTDGSVDNTFTLGFNEFIGVTVIKPSASGKFIIGGQFTKYSPVVSGQIKSICRINSDGTIDGTFNPVGTLGEQASGGVQIMDVEVMSDGSVIAAGIFNSADGSVDNKNLCRFFSNGHIDLGFNTQFDNSLNYAPVRAIAPVDSNDYIIVGGDFTTVNNMVRNHIAKIDNSPSGGMVFSLPSSNFNNNLGVNTGLAELEADGLKLYANGNNLYVNTGKIKGVSTVALYSTSGQLVASFDNVNSYGKTIELGTNAAKGIYVARIITPAKAYAVKICLQ